MIIVPLLLLALAAGFLPPAQAFNLMKMFSSFFNSASAVKDSLPQYSPDMKKIFMASENGSLIPIDLTETVKQLPSAVIDQAVIFFLYTKKENKAYRLYSNDKENIDSSTFDPSLPTKILVHGFSGSHIAEMEQSIKNAYLDSQNVNVICVDWTLLAAPPSYPTAAAFTKPVGMLIAKLIDWLVTSKGADVTSFHLIGHCIGAHAVGFAANSVTSGRIQRVTGLDAAQPLFLGMPAAMRLSSDDAEVVDVIHTCGGYFGFINPIGTHDFYPNGGRPLQPGCALLDIPSGYCSHFVAFRYYAASIKKEFQSKECKSMAEAVIGKCTGSNTALMGDKADQSKPGLYYTKTSSEYAYISV